MSSTLRSATDALVTLLAGINGTGSYSQDLSATGVVQVGVPTLGDGPLPGVWVHLLSMDCDRDADLGAYRRTAKWAIEARVKSTSSSPAVASATACDLLSDLCLAVESNPSLGGYVLDLALSGAAVSGDEAGIPGAAVAAIIVEAYWIADRGQGA